MRNLILTTALVTTLALAGCGGDDDDASPATTGDTAATPATSAASAPSDGSSDGLDDYCSGLAAAFGDSDPGFDQFFTDHPEPSLDDWAAFLPGPIASLTSTLDGLAALDPPSDLAADHATLITAMAAVRDSFQTGLDAAEAGDQAAFDANGQAPGDAMEAATIPLGTACGFEE